jgi:hypothetical protein
MKDKSQVAKGVEGTENLYLSIYLSTSALSISA